MNPSSSDDQREQREFAQRVLRGSAITVIVVLAVVLFVFEGRVLFVLLAGLLFALFLEGTCGFVARNTRVPYQVVLGIFSTTLAASMLFGSYFLGAAVAAQASSFAEQVPRAWQALVDAVHHRPALAEVVGPLAPKAPTGSADLAKVVTGATGLAETLGVVGVVFFLGVYGAAQPRSYTSVLVSLVPLARRARAQAILQEIGVQLTRWICGRVIAMAMVGVCVGAGLALMHVPLALPLGVLAGALAFVEYLGSVASAAPAMLLAFTRSPILAVWVALLFLGVHIVEGYVLTPLLARQMIRFPPAYMLGAQVVLGAIFGVSGLTFATPLVVIATILVRRLYVEDALGDLRDPSSDPGPARFSYGASRRSGALRDKEIRMNQDSKVISSKDVIGFLKAQHEQIKSLFEKVVAARGTDREKVFFQLKSLMSAHEAAEEKVVHPEAKQAIPGGPAEVAARVSEETEAKKALTALSQLDVSSPEFETKIRKLQSAVLAHAKSEEKEEFDKLADKLDEKKLKDMRKAVEAVEASASALGAK